MATIKQEDFIQSVADAFQFIYHYNPVDFLSAMGGASFCGMACIGSITGFTTLAYVPGRRPWPPAMGPRSPPR